MGRLPCVLTCSYVLSTLCLPLTSHMHMVKCTRLSLFLAGTAWDHWYRTSPCLQQNFPTVPLSTVLPHACICHVLQNRLGRCCSQNLDLTLLPWLIIFPREIVFPARLLFVPSLKKRKEEFGSCYLLTVSNTQGLFLTKFPVCILLEWEVCNAQGNLTLGFRNNLLALPRRTRALWIISSTAIGIRAFRAWSNPCCSPLQTTTSLMSLQHIISWYGVWSVEHRMLCSIFSLQSASWTVSNFGREVTGMSGFRCTMNMAVLSSLVFWKYISMYRSLAKKGPWAEHLTSLPKRGVGTLSTVSALNHERVPTSCLQRLEALEANNWTQNNVQRNHQWLQSQVLTAHSTLNCTMWWWAYHSSQLVSRLRWGCSPR